MSDHLRILHLADTHIGAGLPSRPRVDRPRRGDDLIASYRTALGRAFEYDVDLVLHAGDVFDRPNPCGAALAAATAPLLEVASAGIPVVIIPGNHERSALPSSLLLQHEHIHVLDTPRTITFARSGRSFSISGLPCVRRGVAEAFADRLAETEWEQSRADYRLLVLHQTLDSSTCGPVGFRFRSGEDVLDRSQVPGAFDYVALGHIHRHQQLENPLSSVAPFVYSGSTDRISFAERAEPKGCVLVREQGGRLVPHFIEHAVRAMHIIPVDVTDLAGEQIVASVLQKLGEVPESSHLAVRLSGRALPHALQGLQLGKRIEAERPDLLVRVAMQHIEMRSADRQVRPRQPLQKLPPLGGEVWDGGVEDLKQLPDRCGTYLLRDARDTVIYVGKSKRVRTRIRSHLRKPTAGNVYAGWSEQVARVRVRPAGGELEALVAEAILIARVRPAFNRQMRMWSRYCYLVEDPASFGQLRVQHEMPSTDAIAYGPFRSKWTAEACAASLADLLKLAACPETPQHLPLLADQPAGVLCERYYAGQCCGPCAGHPAGHEYNELLQIRHALLNGEQEVEGLVLGAEARAEALDADDTGPEAKAVRETAQLLRSVWESGSWLRQAHALRGGLVLLPGEQAAEPVLLSLRPGAPELLPAADLPRVVRNLPARLHGLLAKSELDLYLTVVRTLAQDPAAGAAWTAAEARQLGAGGLRAAWAASRANPSASVESAL